MEDTKFEGLVLCQDKKWMYFFWYPKGWHRYDLGEGREGVLCSPMDGEPTTFFAVEVWQLPVGVTADDLDTLREGVEEGLASLPGLEIELADESVGSRLITFERVFTFRDGSVTRKRRIRLIYDDNRLYSLMSQGATVEEYERWLPMLNYCHLTFQLGLFDMGALAQAMETE